MSYPLDKFIISTVKVICADRTHLNPCPGHNFLLLRQKGGDLTQFYDKSPYNNKNVQGAK